MTVEEFALKIRKEVAMLMQVHDEYHINEVIEANLDKYAKQEKIKLLGKFNGGHLYGAALEMAINRELKNLKDE